MTQNTLIEYMRERGFNIPQNINNYGKFIRFPAQGKKTQNRSAWLINKGDHAVFGNFVTGEKYTWSAKGKADSIGMTDDDIKEAKKAARQAAAHIKREQQEAAQQAKILWDSYSECNDNHSYLSKKKVKSIGLKITEEGALVIPVFVENKLSSLQYIYPNGFKQFMPGGSVKGGYYPIAEPEKGHSDMIVLCEGYATAYSISHHISNYVYCCFGCHNLEPVAKYIYKKYPECTIVFAGDNDDVGKRCAINAANNIKNDKSQYTIPPDMEGVSDFNDYFNMI